MKRALFIACLLDAVGCQRDKTTVTPEGEPVNVNFRVGVEKGIKAIGDGTGPSGADPRGFYRSSSLSPDHQYAAWIVYFNSGGVYRGGNIRREGLPVRPVKD